jgi:hypothetical protein
LIVCLIARASAHRASDGLPHQVFFDEWEQRAAQAGTRPAPMREAWVNELADKIFFSLARFVNRLRQRLGSWQELVPQLGTCREELQALESDKSSMPAFARQASSKIFEGVKKVYDSYNADDAQVAAAEAAVAMRNDLHGLCVQLNSLQFCRRSVANLAAIIDTRWSRLHPPPPTILAQVMTSWT